WLLPFTRPICFFISLTSRFFFFYAPATTELYTLSLHDALPIYPRCATSRLFLRALRLDASGLPAARGRFSGCSWPSCRPRAAPGDRKSTRLNSSHVKISYAVFCLKKKRQLATITNASVASEPER